MTTEQQEPQEHPGPEWFEHQWPPAKDQPASGNFHHYGLDETIHWSESGKEIVDRTTAVALCRAISAAALAWEVMKANATAAARCEREEV